MQLLCCRHRPRRERVRLYQPPVSPVVERAMQRYRELPWWRRLITRAPKGGRR